MPTPVEAINRIVEYYDTTDWGYRFVLSLDSHLGIHYGYYDDEHRTNPAAILNMNRVVADRVGIEPGMDVFDAGCGIGGSSIWLAQNRQVRATGMTLSHAQRRRAEALALERGVADRTTFLVGDYLETGFPDHSFDVVWGLESICYVNNKREFLKEARRVLKPGGRLVVADGFRTSRQTTSRDERDMASWLNAWAVEDIDTTEEFHLAMRAAGFEHVAVVDIRAHVLPFSRSLYRWSLPCLPIVRVLQWLGFWTRVQADNCLGARWQYRTLVRNLWTYAIFTAW